YETIMKYPGLKTKILFGMILALGMFFPLQVTAMADGPQNKQGEQAVQPGDLDSVVLHLKWYHQFQFAGYYAAKEKGFYAQEGLDVIFKERDHRKGYVQAVLKAKSVSHLILSPLEGSAVDYLYS
ncbi:MAG: ABC transporter substrate-binding protein, partial [Desulfobacterales bacterium]